MSTGNFTFLCRSKIGFGMNGLEHLPFDLHSMGSQKPLVLLDKDAHLGGCTKPLIRAFKESGMTLGICPPFNGNPDADKNLESLKTFYTLYMDKGFDAIIALGTGTVVDLAKALNIAVTLGPDSLKTGALKTGTLKTTDMPRITQPLAPFAYIPTGMGTGMETDTIARFNDKTFSSPFLAPDLVIIDPRILTQDTSDTLINASLTCLSACCEAHVLSGNPPARAYCTSGIELVMENFLPLATHCSVSPGQAMAILVPAILDLMAKDSPGLGNLALAMAGPDKFCTIPEPQRPGVAIQKIQSLLNEIYRISLGTTPRTLADTGLDKRTISDLAESLFSHPQIPETNTRGIDPEQAQAILTHALDGPSENTVFQNPA